ncbi:hypothetical protein CPLU01_14109 [Colletotrichum plurivorum]|uniref:Uncharacterized protein n=1 Tax=Colletotrichum plurivorum TaxID=2175906 RepID=A0A8H6JMP9_9PEZI|nr:hypothetical protein CPLU01_14109 [Colletotrichum plurivorum]
MIKLAGLHISDEDLVTAAVLDIFLDENNKIIGRLLSINKTFTVTEPTSTIAGRPGQQLTIVPRVTRPFGPSHKEIVGNDGHEHLEDTHNQGLREREKLLISLLLGVGDAFERGYRGSARLQRSSNSSSGLQGGNLGTEGLDGSLYARELPSRQSETPPVGGTKP